MRVQVQGMTGGFFDIEIDDEGTVDDLKRAIAEQSGLSQERMILIPSNNPQVHLANEASLLDCGVQDGSLLYLFFTSIDDETTQDFVDNMTLSPMASADDVQHDTDPTPPQDIPSSSNPPSDNSPSDPMVVVDLSDSPTSSSNVNSAEDFAPDVIKSPSVTNQEPK